MTRLERGRVLRTDPVVARQVRIKFADESGIDEGGVRREWYTQLSHEFCKADYALFKPSMDNDYTFQINENSAINEEHLEFFEVGVTMASSAPPRSLQTAY
jgi:hypothetical protein